MMNRIARVVLGLALVACNDVFAYPVVDAETVDDLGPPKTVIAPRSVPEAGCPTVRPYDEESCVNSGSFANGDQKPACEYGTNVDPSCNTHVQCTFSHVWRTDHEPEGCYACPSESDLVEGAPCDEVTDRLCAYPKRTCACAGEDAGRKWRCTPIASDCPETRPLEGQPCVAQRTCDYGACLPGPGLAMTCDGTAWAIAVTKCQ